VIEEQAFHHAGATGDRIEGESFHAAALEDLNGGGENRASGRGGVFRHVVVPMVNNGSQ
jgi:hypothetical protein